VVCFCRFGFWLVGISSFFSCLDPYFSTRVFFSSNPGSSGNNVLSWQIGQFLLLDTTRDPLPRILSER